MQPCEESNPLREEHRSRDAGHDFVPPTEVDRSNEGYAPDLIAWPIVRGYTRFIFRAPGRHPWLASLAMSLVVALAASSLFLLPRTYHTEARIMAQRNLVMPALGNPQRSIPMDADAPTRGAAEIILRDDNLRALIDQTDLLRHWDRSRSPLGRVKDSILAILRGPLDDDERRDALVYLLEHSLKVIPGDGTLTIAIDWPDANMAYRLVGLAQQNFLEAKHALEVSTIAEAISILETHETAARARVDGALEDLRRERDARRPPPEPPLVVHSPPAPTPPPAPKEDPELSTLRTMLVAKRKALQDLEEFRRARIAELQAQLAQQEATYTQAHPAIVATQDSIESLMKDSPQLALLRSEEQQLARQYLEHGGQDPVQEPPPPPRPSAPSTPRILALREVREPPRAEDDVVRYYRGQLDLAIRRYEDLSGRIEAARIELDTARAAFKYRYTLVWPAEVPKRPTRPRVGVLLACGFLAGLVAAYAVATLRELSLGERPVAS